MSLCKFKRDRCAKFQFMNTGKYLFAHNLDFNFYTHSLPNILLVQLQSHSDLHTDQFITSCGCLAFRINVIEITCFVGTLSASKVYQLQIPFSAT